MDLEQLSLTSCKHMRSARPDARDSACARLVQARREPPKSPDRACEREIAQGAFLRCEADARSQALKRFSSASYALGECPVDC